MNGAGELVTVQQVTDKFSWATLRLRTPPGAPWVSIRFQHWWHPANDNFKGYVFFDQGVPFDPADPTTTSEPALAASTHTQLAVLQFARLGYRDNHPAWYCYERLNSYQFDAYSERSPPANPCTFDLGADFATEAWHGANVTFFDSGRIVLRLDDGRVFEHQRPATDTVGGLPTHVRFAVWGWYAGHEGRYRNIAVTYPAAPRVGVDVGLTPGQLSAGMTVLRHVSVPQYPYVNAELTTTVQVTDRGGWAALRLAVPADADWVNVRLQVRLWNSQGPPRMTNASVIKNLNKGNSSVIIRCVLHLLHRAAVEYTEKHGFGDVWPVLWAWNAHMWGRGCSPRRRQFVD